MILNALQKVHELLEDDFSKTVFNSRIEYIFGLGGDLDFLYERYTKSRILGLETYGKETPVSICGAGNLGQKTLRALKHAGYNVACFLDNDKNKQGTKLYGVDVISFIEFMTSQYHEKCIAILDNIRLADSFFSELINLGFPQQQIYRAEDDIVRTAFGNIYFDFERLQLDEDEVFIDAGSYDGESTLEFIKWCKGKYKKIYAVEPMDIGKELTNYNLRNVRDVQICNCALSNQIGVSSFSKQYTGLKGSRLDKAGGNLEEVKVDTIDNILQGEKATFIKMDIEGAELDALKGAKYTLSKYKPKLAISLYHKNEDIYEIPLWLHETIPEYKFYLRHYSNKQWDLVLYCVTE